MRLQVLAQVGTYGQNDRVSMEAATPFLSIKGCFRFSDSGHCPEHYAISPIDTPFRRVLLRPGRAPPMVRFRTIG